MDNLADLFEAIKASSMDTDVKEFLRKAVVITSEEKPLAALERLVGEHLGDLGEGEN